MKKRHNMFKKIFLLTRLLFAVWLTAISVQGCFFHDSKALQPGVIVEGQFSVSIDAVGVQTNVDGTIVVVKPDGATVHTAYMAAADIWGSNGGQLPNGAVEIDGEEVNWIYHAKLPDGPNHAWADVTSIVEDTINAAPSGEVYLTITETISLEGSILAVIFDDPNQTDNTVILFAGIQSPDGDTFNICLEDPKDGNLVLDFSLGIVSSLQKRRKPRSYSIIDVNGIRMTTHAGGQDDGFDSPGGLITVGGFGDTQDYPVDRFKKPSYFNPQYDYDDEFYSLLDFVDDGDRNIKIKMLNPSDSGSIFFAALFVGSNTAEVGDVATLTPTAGNGAANTEHTLTATVLDQHRSPVAEREVIFNIISGPNKDLTATDVTDENGQAIFTYQGTVPGTDTITASFKYPLDTDPSGITIDSTDATMRWDIPVPVVVWPRRSCPKILDLNTPYFGVAILGTPDIDVRQIKRDLLNRVSVSIEGLKPVKAAEVDIAGPGPDGTCGDGPPDGNLDLVLKFETSKILEALEARGLTLADGVEITLKLTGRFKDGSLFQGSDKVIPRANG